MNINTKSNTKINTSDKIDIRVQDEDFAPKAIKDKNIYIRTNELTIKKYTDLQKRFNVDGTKLLETLIEKAHQNTFKEKDNA